jgi:hypothetical protein
MEYNVIYKHYNSFYPKKETESSIRNIVFQIKYMTTDMSQITIIIL